MGSELGSADFSYAASCFLDSSLELRKLEPEDRVSPAIDISKSRLLLPKRSHPSNSVFSICDPDGHV